MYTLVTVFTKGFSVNCYSTLKTAREMAESGEKLSQHVFSAIMDKDNKLLEVFYDEEKFS